MVNYCYTCILEKTIIICCIMDLLFIDCLFFFNHFLGSKICDEFMNLGLVVKSSFVYTSLDSI